MKIRYFLVLSLLFTATQAWARAGGAGGGSSSSNSDESSGNGSGLEIELLFRIVMFFINKGPLGQLFLLIILLIGVYAYFYFSNKKQTSGNTVFKNNSSILSPLKTKNANVLAANPDLESKAKLAFLIIQQSWSEKNLSSMRRFISDGIYQRFNAQFTMRNLLGQTNIMSDVQVTKITTVKSFKDGNYDCVDLCIEAVATDQFVCEKYPKLNSPGGRESFREFWTFIRKQNCKPGLNIYNTENCPQCGAPLTSVLQLTAQCPYCLAHLNGGEFDWVLAEITQDLDYGGSILEKLNLPLLPSLPDGEVRTFLPSFSRALIEDSASNIFMQILIGKATGNSKILKRFTTAKCFEQKFLTKADHPMIYNRLFTRSANLVSVTRQGSFLKAAICIKYCAQAISLDAADVIEMDPTDDNIVLSLIREITPGRKILGSIYAGTCSHCGAPQKDSLLPSCAFCGEVMNDPKMDWIMEDMYELSEFRKTMSSQR